MYKAIFLCAIILIIGCGSVGYMVKEDNVIPHEVNKKPEVYFCPKDNCSQVLVEFIGSARIYVHCALFDIDLKEVITALSRKSHEIDVKLVVDNDNYGEVTGEGVKIDDSNQLTHNKFCVVDGEKVSTGSFNPTERGAYKNNNNLILVYSKFLAENYEEEFKELWNGSFGKSGKNQVKYPIIYLNNKKIENYFCPDDKCKEHVIGVLRNAKQSIYFMTFSFTDEDVADAILFHDDIDIRGVFEKIQAGSEYSQYKRLRGFKLDVIIDKNKYNMHHKVFIVDNSTVITGSYNPSGAGNYRNDENMVIIHDEKIAKRYLEEFDNVWNWENKKK